MTHIIESYLAKSTNAITSKQRKRGNASAMADARIKHCKRCNLCWEKSLNFDNKKSKKDMFSYYNNFPSFGKVKEMCPKCIRLQENS